MGDVIEFGRPDITGVELIILSRQDEETLARWYCMLNSWDWPEEIPNVEPKPKLVGERTPRRDALMGYILGKVSQQSIMAHWNRAKMTEDEFNDWFNETFGDK
jgi:hypothetical protein